MVIPERRCKLANRELEDCFLLRGLNDAEVEKLLSIAEERTYSKGDVLVRQGEAASQLFVILQGMTSVKTKYGDKMLDIVELGPGQLVGEMALVENGVHSATVEVVETPTKALVFDVDKFLALCEAEPRMGYWLMRNIASDIAFKIYHNNLKMLL